MNAPEEKEETVPRGPDALRMAIVGLGRMGLFHANLVARHVPEIDVVALADSRREVVESAGQFFGEARRFEDGLASLDVPGLDACLVATSTASHREFIETAIAKGLHVFCEKPITLDPVEVEALWSTAANSGVTLQTGFWRRFSPAWMATRDAVRRGNVGTPILARSSQWDASAPPLAFCDRNVSGGLFVDCGVHDFDIIEWVTGRRIRSVTSVAVALANRDLASVSDVDNALLVLELEDETVGLVDISRNGGYVDEVRMEVLGSEGSILLTTEPQGRAVLRTKRGIEELIDPSDTPAFDAGVIGELRAFARRCRGGEISIPDALDDARALRLARAAWTSHESGGQRVQLDSSGVPVGVSGNTRASGGDSR